MQPIKNILEQIRYLGKINDFDVDKENYNRHKIIVKEPSGCTAYCFSTPIYNLKNGKFVSLNFKDQDKTKTFDGSNCSVSVSKNICSFENEKGRVLLEFLIPKLDKDVRITSTLNGLNFSANTNNVKFKLRSQTHQSGIWFNGQHFSIMADKFLPFASVAALYAIDENGDYFPASLSYEEKGEREYEITVFCAHPAKSIEFEVNLYEHKLFQDTTVESKNPDKNNAFGAIAFIGRTEDFGEQWLYLRPDFFKISDLYSKSIEHIYLHIPVLNNCEENVEAYIPQKRFCSFGSTWNKKVDQLDRKITSVRNGNYLTLDVTDVFTGTSTHALSYNEGLIIKKPKSPDGKDDFIPISTGDSYSYPQILEIKYK